MGEIVLIEKATELHQKILVNGNLAAQALIDFAKNLKQMRDEKLYIPLGYGKFENYCEQAVGLKRRQVYNYIQVIENLKEEFVQSTAQMGIEKLKLLSGLSQEMQEDFIKENNVEEMTTRELQQAIKEKKQVEQRTKELESNLESTKKLLKDTQETWNKQEEKFFSTQERLFESEGKIRVLENKLRENKEVIKEVEKVVIPSDYEELKRKAREAQDNITEYENQLKKANADIKELKEKSLAEADVKLEAVNRIRFRGALMDGLRAMNKYITEAALYVDFASEDEVESQVDRFVKEIEDVVFKLQELKDKKAVRGSIIQIN